jgi:hypothetical protein
MALMHAAWLAIADSTPLPTGVLPLCGSLQVRRSCRPGRHGRRTAAGHSLSPRSAAGVASVMWRSRRGDFVIF